VVREGVGARGEMTQALYAHMNNKRKMKKMVYNYITILMPILFMCLYGSNKFGIMLFCKLPFSLNNMA
jgi:hypothetical protein